MYPIGAIAAVDAAGLGSLGAQLPWAWFALLAIVDGALVVTVIGRRRRARAELAGSANPVAMLADTLITIGGWRVPSSRARAIPARPARYTWPLHTEYIVSRLA